MMCCTHTNYYHHHHNNNIINNNENDVKVEALNIHNHVHQPEELSTHSETKQLSNETRVDNIKYSCKSNIHECSETNKVASAEIISETKHNYELEQEQEQEEETKCNLYNDFSEHSVRTHANMTEEEQLVKPCNGNEQINLELRKLIHRHSQDGPFIESQIKDSETSAVQDRSRREIERVPHISAFTERQSLATSFRRLPKDVILPNEFELRSLYPMSTTLPLIEGNAYCVDGHGSDIDANPLPIQYSMLTPPGFDARKEYPYLVVLSDGSGMKQDFEDVCVHLFERPTHSMLMREQEWVVIAPVIAMRHGLQCPNEAVVARFCEWVVTTFNVEHNQVHLFGKGHGGNAALRTVLYEKNVARSVTAILGRLDSPFRPTDWPIRLAPNYNGVHSLVFVPGNLTKINFIYKFKLMLDLAKVQPPLRNIHFAQVFDHQIYYAINPYELWNHMRYFREVDAKLIDQGKSRKVKYISNAPLHLQ